MGGCYCECSTRTALPHEDFVRDIVLSLRITKLSYRALKKRLKVLTCDSKRFNKEFIRENFSGYFYEKDEIANSKYFYQSKLYDYFIDSLDQEITLFKMMLLLFPLLSKTKYPAYDFADILINLKDEGFTTEDLYQVFINMYEFYSFKLNKILTMISEEDSVRKNLIAANNLVYKYDYIDKAVNRIIESFDIREGEEPKDTKMRFHETFENQKIFFVKDIRDSLVRIHEE